MNWSFAWLRWLTKQRQASAQAGRGMWLLSSKVALSWAYSCGLCVCLFVN
jgi:hypothetical protein